MIDYIKLTKPTIMLLVLFTGATALIVEGSMLNEPGRFLLFMLGLYLTGGCANSLNQYFEREIDSKMTRTASRRPLPQGRIKPAQALTFSILIGLTGLAILAFYFNWLTALFSLATILFYGLFYTLFLKPNTPQNIVIGGAAGAMAPVGAWAAATGGTAFAPWLMFAIIFLWTPPHFWSLAIVYKDDYKNANLPMLPVVRGDKATLVQILVYSFLLVISTLVFAIISSSWIYLSTGIILGIILLKHCFRATRQRDIADIKSLFHFSILYLFGLFGAMIADALLLK